MIGNHFGGLGGLLASFLPQQYPQMYGQGPMMHGGMQQPVQPFGGPAQMFSPAAFASSDGSSSSTRDPELEAWLEANLEGGSDDYTPGQYTKEADISDIQERIKRMDSYHTARMRATNDYRYNRITKEEYDQRLHDIERLYGEPE